MAFDLFNVLTQSGGEAPGVTVDPQQDRIAELLRIIGQAPEELPVPPAITPLQATTAPVADALSAAAAALNRQTGLRTGFTRQLQQLRDQRSAVERSNVAGRNQATWQAAGVELDEIRRQQAEATRKAERAEDIKRGEREIQSENDLEDERIQESRRFSLESELAKLPSLANIDISEMSNDELLSLIRREKARLSAEQGNAEEAARVRETSVVASDLLADYISSIDGIPSEGVPDFGSQLAAAENRTAKLRIARIAFRNFSARIDALERNGLPPEEASELRASFKEHLSRTVGRLQPRGTGGAPSTFDITSDPRDPRIAGRMQPTGANVAGAVQQTTRPPAAAQGGSLLDQLLGIERQDENSLVDLIEMLKRLFPTPAEDAQPITGSGPAGFTGTRDF